MTELETLGGEWVKTPRPHGTVNRYCHGPDENGDEAGCRCAECMDAHRVYMRSHRAKNPDYRERQRLVKQAYNRATQTLRARHPEEFAWLCALERGEALMVLEAEASAPLEQMEGELSLMRVDAPKEPTHDL